MYLIVVIRERREGQPPAEMARWNMPEAPMTGDAILFAGKTYVVKHRMWIHPTLCNIVVELSH